MPPLRLYATSAADNTDAPADPLGEERLIGRAEFQRLLGVGQSTFERLKARGVLPPCIELSRTCHRWKLRTVLAWIAEREQAGGGS
jgi:predicted DNA-binding transcriptional regulator AlpA